MKRKHLLFLLCISLIVVGVVILFSTLNKDTISVEHEGEASDNIEYEEKTEEETTIYEDEIIEETDREETTLKEEEKTDSKKEESKKEDSNNKKDEVKEEINYSSTLMILGDSRACSLVNSLIMSDEWNLKEDRRIKADQGVIFFYDNNNTELVLCVFGGGNLQAGAYDVCQKWASDIIEEKKAEKIKFFIIDMFGLGDVGTGLLPDSKGSYNEKNKTFAKSLPENCTYYQSTVGPIDEKGSMGKAGAWTNEMIREYNTHFKKSSNVKLFDLYFLLEKDGYACVISETDPSGVHYDMSTDMLIMKNLMEIMH